MPAPVPPPPMCACAHVYGFHFGGLECRHQDDPDDDETRCRCAKFRVPRGSGRRKPKHTVRATGGRGLSMAPKKPKRPWWR